MFFVNMVCIMWETEKLQAGMSNGIW